MSMQLKSEDFHALVDLLQGLPELANVRDRRRLLEATLAGTPRAATLLAGLDLDGPPRGAAVQVVSFLAGFGQVAAGREALVVFLEGLLAGLGEEQARRARDLLAAYDAGGSTPESGTPLAGDRRRLEHLRVVLASPGDVRAERDLVPGVLDEVNREVRRRSGPVPGAVPLGARRLPRLSSLGPPRGHRHLRSADGPVLEPLRHPDAGHGLRHRA
jgi:hypothetical protein